jgi:hypothetical protein
MLNLLKQALFFISIHIANSWFRYFFLVVNVMPLVLYFFFDFEVYQIISYFVLEGVIYCFMNMIYVRFLDLPVLFVKVVLVMMSLSFLVLATYFIPLWNPNDTSDADERIAFWNYVALLFSFYTIDYFMVGDQFYQWEEGILKKNIITKFGILFLVAIFGAILSKYIKMDIAFLLIIIGAKTIIDLLAMQKSYAK